MFVKIVKPYRKHQKGIKWNAHITYSGTNKQSNFIGNKIKITSIIDTLFSRHAQRREAIHVIVRTQRGSEGHPGEYISRWPLMMSKFSSTLCPKNGTSNSPTYESLTCSLGDIPGNKA